MGYISVPKRGITTGSLPDPVRRAPQAAPNISSGAQRSYYGGGTDDLSFNNIGGAILNNLRRNGRSGLGHALHEDSHDGPEPHSHLKPGGPWSHSRAHQFDTHTEHHDESSGNVTSRPKGTEAKRVIGTSPRVPPPGVIGSRPGVTPPGVVGSTPNANMRTQGTTPDGVIGSRPSVQGWATPPGVTGQRPKVPPYGVIGSRPDPEEWKQRLQIPQTVGGPRIAGPATQMNIPGAIDTTEGQGVKNRRGQAKSPFKAMPNPRINESGRPAAGTQGIFDATSTVRPRSPKNQAAHDARARKLWE